MAYIPEPINKMRTEDIYTIDMIACITLENHNQQITYQLGSDRQILIPRPYFIHDLRKDKTCKVGKTDTTDLKLSSIFDIFRNKETQELDLSRDLDTLGFARTMYIEFFAEDNTDKPYINAKNFHADACAKLKDLKINLGNTGYPISVSFTTYHCSYKDPKFHTYSRYMLLKTDINPEIIVIPNIQKYKK